MKIKIYITSFLILLLTALLYNPSTVQAATNVNLFQITTGLLPIFSFDPIINISHILDHNSTLGSLLRVVFGYTSKPTLLEIVLYIAYILIIVATWKYTDRLRVKVART